MAQQAYKATLTTLNDVNWSGLSRLWVPLFLFLNLTAISSECLHDSLKSLLTSACFDSLKCGYIMGEKQRTISLAKKEISKDIANRNCEPFLLRAWHLPYLGLVFKYHLTSDAEVPFPQVKDAS